MNILIKSTYLLPAALLMLTACSQEEPTPTEPAIDQIERIHFRTSLPGATSRAQIVSNDNLTEFKVTVFNPADAANGKLDPFINNISVIKSEESDVFSSEDCMWPAPGREKYDLTFFAYYPAPANTDNNTTINGIEPAFDFKIPDFTISKDISRQVDFIAAYKSVSMKSEMYTNIQLDFEHQLSRVEVNAKGENKSCKIEIAGVCIGGTYSKATFDFKPQSVAGDWILGDEKQTVQYIYAPGDKVVAISNTTSGVSIMGGTQDGNYAMLLPAEYTSWNYKNDNTNSGQGLYLGVLLRVIDTKGKQQYPYIDTNQGPNALNIPRVYLAVGSDGTVMSGQLYKGNDGKYYTDSAMKTAYTLPQGSVVKEFGWSALPITGDWKPGYYYTYTLDYTYGVGLHTPDVEPSDGPNAGDPIISDKVGLTVTVKEWQNGSSANIVVPGS
ncbi:MAG: fimbrillin family protein [Muribaculaceae bacterium]|nr:fimbrillin family protein [Muribaculaceae bacterium]